MFAEVLILKVVSHCWLKIWVRNCVLILSPWLRWTQTGGGGMRLYGGCVEDVLDVSVWSSSLSSSTDSSEFSKSSSRSSVENNEKSSRSVGGCTEGHVLWLNMNIFANGVACRWHLKNCPTLRVHLLWCGFVCWLMGCHGYHCHCLLERWEGGAGRGHVVFQV